MPRAPSAAVLIGLLRLAPQAQAQTDTRPVLTLPELTLGVRDSVARVAQAQVGARYRFGAAQPGRRFDCSGLVQYVMSVFHVALPRTADQQARLGVAVPRDSSRLLPGDILTFGPGKHVTHVGIYVGDGRYVHASSRKRTVVEVPLPAPGTRQARLWKGARRVLDTDADTLPAPPTEPIVGAS